jgi:hypothetical protein
MSGSEGLAGGEADATPPPPTPFKVSTITAIGSVSTTVNLHLFYDNLSIIKAPAESGETGYVYAELAQKHCDVSRRGHAATGRASRALKTAEPAQSQGAAYKEERGGGPGHFDNQVTVIFRLAGLGTAPATMNMKVFKNGKVQITGVKQVQQGLVAIEHLVRVLAAQEEALPGTVGCRDKLQAAGYRVCLINSDFFVGFPIRRERLYSVLRREYATVCTFEPCIYPGVKIKFMWNQDPRSTPCGVCTCTAPCSGRGDGGGNGECRKVTIAVFQSGNVIITGAHTLDQIQSAYDFVVSLAERHYEFILKPTAVVGKAQPA